MTESLGALTNERDNKYRKDVDRQERNKRKTKSRLCVSVDVERDYVVRCDGVSEQFSTCRQNGGAGQVVRRESSFCPPRSLYQVKKPTTNLCNPSFASFVDVVVSVFLLSGGGGGIEMSERQK